MQQYEGPGKYVPGLAQFSFPAVQNLKETPGKKTFAL